MSGEESMISSYVSDWSLFRLMGSS